MTQASLSPALGVPSTLRRKGAISTCASPPRAHANSVQADAPRRPAEPLLAMSPTTLFEGDAIQDSRYRLLLVEAFQHYLSHIKWARNAGARLTATENLRHVQRLVQVIQAHAAELRSLAIDVETLLAGVALSDIGKGFPAMQALIAAKRQACGANGRDQAWKETDFFKAFMNHEAYGISLLEARAVAYDLDPEEVSKIRRVIAWHNGPGLRDSWWGQNYTAQMGGARYGVPDSPEGVVHTILDRVDGGSLYRHVDEGSGETTLIGGPKKIAVEVITRDGDTLAEAVVGVFFRLSRDARRQIEALQRFKRTGGYMGSASQTREASYDLIFASAFVRDQMVHLERTRSLMSRIAVVLPNGAVKGWADRRELLKLFAVGKVVSTSREGGAMLHDTASRVLVDGVVTHRLDDLLAALAAEPASDW
ncbi:HD domain-containing protein [Candidatus Entotheonella palauensis]|uniref:HD domain-containing protein n=1 Tax=Candidatus Entotheonella palauensis TaxID=93172 RepID=UPI000B7FAA20|nr:HD domain-containing protein [Candidatus Entotheonella palauensis]